MRIVKAFLVFAVIFSFAPLAGAQDDAALERKLDLARQLQEVRPAKDQIEAAIERYTARMQPKQREVYSSALRGVFNYKALEKISMDAYAEVFTEEELQAMVEYYTKPEARSASEKTGDYAELVYPEIIRMLDRAMMRVKTGGTSGQ